MRQFFHCVNCFTTLCVCEHDDVCVCVCGGPVMGGLALVALKFPLTLQGTHTHALISLI